MVNAPPKVIGLPPILLTNGEPAVPPKSPVNWTLPFVDASASGVAAPVTKLETKAVVATWFEIVPGDAVGAVGVPVNAGDAIVALNNISAVFAVILAVLDAIKVGSVAMVDEFTPPTALIVVVNVPIPLPLASPVKVINWSPEFTPPTVTFPTTVNVVLVIVPPAMVNPFSNAVGLTPFMVLFVSDSVPLMVESVPDVGKIILLAAVVVMVKSPIPFVIILLPNVIVLPLLLMPVPPLAPGKIELMVFAESENLELNEAIAYGTDQNWVVPILI